MNRLTGFKVLEAEEFENTIDFLKQFNDLYWKSELVAK